MNSNGRSFFHVFSMICTAVRGGNISGFTLSVIEGIVTLFLTGVALTLPINVCNRMRFGFTPWVNAISTLVAMVVIGLASNLKHQRQMT